MSPTSRRRSGGAAGGAALIALARPRQWVKNGLVIGAPGAAGALGYDDVPARVLVTCAAFCLLSGGDLCPQRCPRSS